VEIREQRPLSSKVIFDGLDNLDDVGVEVKTSQQRKIKDPRRILALVNGQGKMSLAKHMTAEFGISERRARDWIDALEWAGLVTVTRAGKSKHVHLTDRGYQELEQLGKPITRGVTFCGLLRRYADRHLSLEERHPWLGQEFEPELAPDVVDVHVREEIAAKDEEVEARPDPIAEMERMHTEHREHAQRRREQEARAGQFKHRFMAKGPQATVAEQRKARYDAASFRDACRAHELSYR
jgi:predicted transcriptional regulator